MAVLAPSDVECAAVERDRGAALGQPPPMRGDERGAGAAAARPGDPGAALPDTQPDVLAIAIVATPILARCGNSGSCSRSGPERREIDRVDVVDKKRRVRVADIGADRLRQRTGRQIDAIGVHRAGERDSRQPIRAGPISTEMRPSGRLRLRAARPRSRSAPAGRRSREDQIGDAAGGIAAGLGLAAVGIADAHQDLGRRMARRLEQDQLVAADAGTPIGERASALRRARQRCGDRSSTTKSLPSPCILRNGILPMAPLIWRRGGPCPTRASDRRGRR